MKEMSKGLGSVVWGTWDRFWQKTNICGINNAGNSRDSLLRRIVWIVIFCAFSIFTAYGVLKVVQDFLAYPVDTKVVVQHSDWVGWFIDGKHFCDIYLKKIS